MRPKAEFGNYMAKKEESNIEHLKKHKKASENIAKELKQKEKEHSQEEEKIICEEYEKECLQE